MKALITRMITGSMMIAIVQPAIVQAGQKEWATAGKILTGVVATSVITDAFTARTHVEPRRVGPSSFPHDRGVPGRTPRISPPRPCPIDRFRARPQPPAWSYRHLHMPTSYPAIIVQKEPGQRLYQPAVHGHPAYLQVWSARENRWISIQTHPSIW